MRCSILIPLVLVCASQAAPAQQPDPVRGSTAGLVEAAPEWGLGVQLGTRGASGLQAQKMAFKDGALTMGLGFGGGVYSVYADYVMFLDKFELAALPEAGGYNQTRGRVMPYFGGGLMAARGISLHLPFGVQYVMLRDPFAFYAGGVLSYGLIEGERIELRPQLLAGGRVLL